MATFEVTLDIRPADALSPEKLEEALQRGVTKAGFYLEGAVKDTITPFTRTGRLRSSVIFRSGGRLVAYIVAGGSNVNYAAAVDTGSKAHIIRPRNARVLAWPTSGRSAAGLGRGRAGTLRGGNAGFAFARVVHHPGFKGHQYMERTWQRERDNVVRIIEAEVAAAI